MEPPLGPQDLRQEPLQRTIPERGVRSCPLPAFSGARWSQGQGGQPGCESDGRVGTVRGRRRPRGRRPARCALGASLPRTPEGSFPSRPGPQDPLTRIMPPCSSTDGAACNPGPDSPSQELSPRTRPWDPYCGLRRVFPLYSCLLASLASLFLFSEAIERERLAWCAFRGNWVEGPSRTCLYFSPNLSTSLSLSRVSLSPLSQPISSR